MQSSFPRKHYEKNRVPSPESLRPGSATLHAPRGGEVDFMRGSVRPDAGLGPTASPSSRDTLRGKAGGRAGGRPRARGAGVPG